MATTPKVGLWIAVEVWTFGEDYSAEVLIDKVGDYHTIAEARVAAYSAGLAGRFLINPDGDTLLITHPYGEQHWRVRSHRWGTLRHFYVELEHVEGTAAQRTGHRNRLLGGDASFQP